MFELRKKVKELLDEDDWVAVDDKDSEYLNTQGADAYVRGDFETARTFYELASTLGNRDAATNLGYMYLYGKGAPIDYSVAHAFYKIGAKRGSIDAYYKLGNMYQFGKGVPEDNEKANEYYDKAMELLEKEDKADPSDYPSIFYTFGREQMPGGMKEENLGKAYDDLLIAEEGYLKQINVYHATYYKGMLEETRRLMNQEVFDSIRSQERKEPIYELYDKEYKIKGLNTKGTLIKVTYSYATQENIYYLEDQDHEIHAVRESELAECIQDE